MTTSLDYLRLEYTSVITFNSLRLGEKFNHTLKQRYDFNYYAKFHPNRYVPSEKVPLSVKLITVALELS